MKQRAMKGWISGIALLVAASGLGADEKVDYEKQIKPLLETYCVKCHGAKKKKGKLRLDAPDMIDKGGKEGKAVVGGDLKKSPLVQRITLPRDHDDVMPPEDEKAPKPAEIELIKKWVAEGAGYGNAVRTAVAAPAAPTLPKVAKADDAAVKKVKEAGALIMPLAANTNLLNVDFRAVADKTTDQQLELLKPLAAQIAWLNLGQTKVSDSGLAKLSGLKQLRRLYLDRSSIGDAGLAHLKGFSELEYLNLYGSKVSDKGLAHLGGLPKLRKLFVWQTGVTKEGAAAFAKGREIMVNTGWEAPPEPKKVEKPTGKGPINQKCPFTGKAINAKCTFEYQGQTIAFCCGNCLAKFKKDPKANIGKVKEFKAPKKTASGGPINSKCPLSGKEINAKCTFAYQGQTIAFCCGNCLAKFKKDPKAFIAKVKEFKKK